MPDPKSKRPTHSTPADTTEAVNDFMTTLDHPFKAEIQMIRKLILGVDASIAEGIKWNAPSFRTTEYFATMNLRAKSGIGIILHLGAKVRELAAGCVQMDDPKRLLRWLGKDRAMVEFKSAKEIKDNEAAHKEPLIKSIPKILRRYRGICGVVLLVR